jgi:ATP-dependent protease ClpP protease subunit
MTNQLNKAGEGHDTGWYQINALANDVLDLHIYGSIGGNLGWDEESVSTQDLIKQLYNSKASRINLYLNSSGGSAVDGIAIYNALRRHSAQKLVIIDGWALSAASLIAMAGDTVQMPASTQLMIHNPWSMAVGDAATMRKEADVLERMKQSLVAVYQAKCGQPPDQISTWMDAETWFDAAAAVEAGLADQVLMAASSPANFRGIPHALSIYHVPLSLQSRFTSVVEGKSYMPPETIVSDPKGQTPALITPPIQADPEVSEAQILAKDKSRRTEIKSLFQPFLQREGYRELYDSLVEDYGITPEVASRRLLAKLGEGAVPVYGAGGLPSSPHFSVDTVLDARDKFRTGIMNALLMKTGKLPQDGANPYRGMSLLDVARQCLNQLNINSKGWDKRQIVAQAITQGTSDFPVILENTLGKSLLEAYRIAPTTWQRWCKVINFTDFRPHKFYRSGSIGNLLPINELGEFHNLTISDGERESGTAGTKGGIINLSRQAIINDDLGVFTDLATQLGRTAARTVDADVYTLLTANSGAGPTMGDGTALFDATHANLAGTGTVITITSLDAARIAIRKQKDSSGNDYLDLIPAIWLGPVDISGLARVANEAQYDTEVSQKFQVPNRVRGLFRDVVDTPRLTGTAWYIFADPLDSATIGVGFLDGVQEPFLDQEVGFQVDGIAWKVRLDYGVCGLGWRGAYKNPGA